MSIRILCRVDLLVVLLWRPRYPETRLLTVEVRTLHSTDTAMRPCVLWYYVPYSLCPVESLCPYVWYYVPYSGPLVLRIYIPTLSLTTSSQGPEHLELSLTAEVWSTQASLHPVSLLAMRSMFPLPVLRLRYLGRVVPAPFYWVC